VIGGVISIFFGIFHLAFWYVFNWKTSLASLSPLNRAIMEVLNVHAAYTILVFGGLSLFLSRELLETRLGRALSCCMAGFWFLRAVNEVAFFENPPIQTTALVVIFVGVGLLYATAAWQWRGRYSEAVA
jgi:hypothetical protein